MIDFLLFSKAGKGTFSGKKLGRTDLYVCVSLGESILRARVGKDHSQGRPH